MKRFSVRLASLLALTLAIAVMLAPAASAAPAAAVQAATVNVTFQIYDQEGNAIATVVTSEQRLGPVAIGTWRSTSGSAGTLWAYHYSYGLVARVQQATSPQGSGTITLIGSFGSMWYSMATGQQGVVYFTATSPSLNVWLVQLLGPVPPIFLGG